MDEFYEIEVAGLKRKLPVCPLNDKMSIAAFIMFGDVELTEKCAKELLAKMPEFDVIITPEAKSIPLAYEMSRLSGKKYIVARKYPKLYMKNIHKVSVKSITTDKLQTLYIDGTEAAALKGRRVAIVDDVISTGESVSAVRKLVDEAEGNIACMACVLAEGDAAKRDDIIFLKELPLIFK